MNLNRVLLRYRVHARSLTQAEWSGMDGHAARIAARELVVLGMPTGDRDIQFHRNVGRGGCFQVLRQEELHRAEQWLHALMDANRCTGRYPEKVFRKIVAGVWFKVCYHAGALGTAMLSRYTMSALRRSRHTSAKEWLALGLVALRGRSV